MDKICAIVDCQGFLFKDRFVAREVAIVSDNISQCQELNPRINWRDLPEDERATILYCTKFVHGLHFNPFNPVDHCYIFESENINKVLEIWYDMVATQEKPFFAIKNNNLVNILKASNIPFIDLDNEQFGFPNTEKLQQKYGSNYICAYHKKPARGSNITIRCSLRKCAQIFRELKSRTIEMEAV